MVFGGVSGPEKSGERREFKVSKERNLSEDEARNQKEAEALEILKFEKAEAEKADLEQAEREMEALEGLHPASATEERGILPNEQAAYIEAKQRIGELQNELSKLEAELADAEQAPKSLWTKIVGNKFVRELKQKIALKQNEIEEQSMVREILTVEEAMLEESTEDGGRKERVKAPRASKGGGIKGITS